MSLIAGRYIGTVKRADWEEVGHEEGNVDGGKTRKTEKREGVCVIHAFKVSYCYKPVAEDMRGTRGY